MFNLPFSEVKTDKFAGDRHRSRLYYRGGIEDRYRRVDGRGLII
jgi:hypothetical protein